MKNKQDLNPVSEVKLIKIEKCQQDNNIENKYKFYFV